MAAPHYVVAGVPVAPIPPGTVLRAELEAKERIIAELEAKLHSANGKLREVAALLECPICFVVSDKLHTCDCGHAICDKCHKTRRTCITCPNGLFRENDLPVFLLTQIHHIVVTHTCVFCRQSVRQPDEVACVGHQCPAVPCHGAGRCPGRGADHIAKCEQARTAMRFWQYEGTDQGRFLSNGEREKVRPNWLEEKVTVLDDDDDDLPPPKRRKTRPKLSNLDSEYV